MKPISFLAACLVALLMSACASTGGSSSSAAGDTYFEVHRDGRIHVFYDAKTFQDYLRVGETAFRITRIGAGPQGETLVFGLAEADRIKTRGLAGPDIWDGKKKPGKALYAEFRRDNVIYVLSNYADIVALRQGQTPANTQSQPASGPNGENLFYATDSADQLMQLFAGYHTAP